MDLILENAKVLTMDAQSSVGWYVAISGDRITSVGSREGLRDVPTAGAKRIDCQGMTLVPWLQRCTHPCAGIRFQPVAS